MSHVCEDKWSFHLSFQFKSKAHTLYLLYLYSPHTAIVFSYSYKGFHSVSLYSAAYFLLFWWLGAGRGRGWGSVMQIDVDTAWHSICKICTQTLVRRRMRSMATVLLPTKKFLSVEPYISPNRERIYEYTAYYNFKKRRIQQTYTIYTT